MALGNLLRSRTASSALGSARAYNDATDLVIYRSLQPYSRKVDVNRRNNKNKYTVACTLDDATLDGTTDRWFACPSFSGNGRIPVHSYPEYAIKTYNSFNRDTRSPGVTQTWYCTETGIPYEPKAADQGATGACNSYVRASSIVCRIATNIIHNVVTYRNPWNLEFVSGVFITKRCCSLDAERNKNRVPPFPLLPTRLPPARFGDLKQTSLETDREFPHRASL
ncbi:hypothetical protein V8F33_009551 [Rhypophila sp. PSN 637]